jgi:hypothetical protein
MVPSDGEISKKRSTSNTVNSSCKRQDCQKILA